MIKKQCEIHGLNKHYKRNDTNKYRCYQCSLDAQTRRRLKIKKMLLQKYGNECKLCKYNKHYGSLSFHHLDPSTKKFRLSKLGSHSLKDILAEAEKCILLCCNCHQEIHDKVATI